MSADETRHRRAMGAARGSRRAACVLIAASVLLTAGWAGAVGADPPPSSNPTVPPTTVDPGSGSTTTAPGSGSSTTAPGETTTTLTRPTVTAGPGGFGPPTTDPDAPPEPPMRDPSPEVRILLEQLLAQNRQKLAAHKVTVVERHDVDVSKYRNREASAAAALKKARADVDAATAKLARIEDQLRADAIARYMSPGPPKLEFLVKTPDARDRTRSVLSRATIEVHRKQRVDEIARRKRLQETVEDRRRDLEQAKAATGRAEARARAAELAVEKAQKKAAFEQQLLSVAHQRLSARSAVLSTSVQGWSLPIEGESVFTGEELAQWFIQRGIRSHARVPITDLAEYYVDEGNDQGIRGDMAFAQSILETGSFSNPDTIGLNNFAGIGHCDSCGSGFAFASPLLGVRAQIQLLAQYSQRGVELVHPLVDRRLRGPSGCCQTWTQLTHTWATNGNYGPKIMGVYREMLWWLVRERGMTPRVGPR